MTYVLYGNAGSGSCIVECALAEIGAPYELRDVSLADDAQRDDAYAAVNPQRKLPTLITPSGEKLTESAAIAIALAERHPDIALLPDPGSRERAQALRWLIFVAAELYPLVEINDYPERFVADPAHADGARERARELWRQRWLVAERAIAGDPWLLPAGFCITDVYIAVVSRWAQQTAWRAANLPKIERLCAAVVARPTLADVWARHFGG